MAEGELGPAWSSSVSRDGELDWDILTLENSLSKKSTAEARTFQTLIYAFENNFVFVSSCRTGYQGVGVGMATRSA